MIDNEPIYITLTCPKCKKKFSYNVYPGTAYDWLVAYLTLCNKCSKTQAVKEKNNG